MNPAERVIRRLDGVQQRHVVPAFVVGVIKKFGDDNAGSLVSNLAHSAFGTVFPLLLFLVTVLGMVLGSNRGLRTQVLHSAVNQFPIVGNDLAGNIRSLHRHSTLGLSIGLLGLIWGSVGLAQAGIFAMEQIWNLPGPDRPNYPKRMLRAVLFLSVLGVGTLVTTFLTAAAPASGRGAADVAGAAAVSAITNSVQFLLVFRILTPAAVQWRKLVVGALAAGLGWTVLQEFGTLIVEHYLRHDSALYGLFAIVMGLFTWIYFLAELTVYCAEINVVLDRRLWPRAIVQPPLTEADRMSMAAQAQQNQRRPEQHVEVTFDGRAQLQDEYLRGPSDPEGDDPEDRRESAR